MIPQEQIKRKEEKQQNADVYKRQAFCYNITESGTDTGGTGMKGKGSRCSIRNVVTFAGAFIAWIIGSGFATGQEILQFFTSYGSVSYTHLDVYKRQG